jgi:Fe-S cluster assembly protein SufD
VYQGKVYVARDAQKTDANQLSKALILSEGAEMDNKPELEIYADDVKCSHGATTGQLDEDAMFYMRSRGIGEEDARSLLIEAFVKELAEEIDDLSIRDEIMQKIQGNLV